MEPTENQKRILAFLAEADDDYDTYEDKDPLFYTFEALMERDECANDAMLLHDLITLNECGNTYLAVYEDTTGLRLLNLYERETFLRLVRADPARLTIVKF